MATEKSEILEPDRVNSSKGSEPIYVRAEIDTSAPFESVKEAANRFGGMGFWKPISSHNPSLRLNSSHVQNNEEMVDIFKVEEQAAQLEKDLITKEKETFHVLKELETTKNIVEELKLKLQKEASELNTALKVHSHSLYVLPEDENDKSKTNIQKNGFGTLLELKLAKLNLTRTTNDLSDVRATVDIYNKKIEKERMSLDKTCQRLSSSTMKISFLDEELNQTKQKLELVKGTEGQELLQKLSSETEHLNELGEAAKSEVLRTMSEIEQTKSEIRTAEIRLVAAKKIKEAAKASESLAFAEIKALSNSEKTLTLTFEEYSTLITKAREAEQASKSRVVNAMVQVDESNASKTEILKRVEEATEEVKITKKALEEALSRVEAANKGKLEVEESLREWRSEHVQKRRSLHNDTKFKNSHSTLHRKDEVKQVLKPCLSIGQILSRKLLFNEEGDDETRAEKRVGESKVSLRQMLSKFNDDLVPVKKSGKENNNEVPVKRKKFGFARISLLVTKQSKKKKSGSSMCRGA